MKIRIDAWKHGERIPTVHTADGADRSPAIGFEEVPEGTRAFALLCDDPDAPVGTWVHWVLFDIPGTARGLPEGVASAPTLPDGSRSGKNSWDRHGYGGPSPPPGKPHRYFFRLYALPAPLGLPPGSRAAEVEERAKRSALARAEYMGTYGRSR
ncbi:MAG: YbhB/YbcL family Raf kinase inhibitor-like protein [Thermoplasmata archaeon]